MQGQLGAIQADVEFIAQAAFLKHALLKAGDDFRVHAAMMIARDISDALAHAVGQANDEFVSRAAGINSLFHWTHTFNRLVQEAMLAVSHVIVTGLTVFSTSCSLGIVICIDKASQPTQIFDANYVSHCVEYKGSLPAPVVINAGCWAKDGHLFARYKNYTAVARASWLISGAATGFACLAQQQAVTLRRQAVKSISPG